MTKYKNLKAARKKNLSNNAREMKQTGGGTAKIVTEAEEELFGFTDSQIVGLNNPVDDDSPEVKIDSNPISFTPSSSMSVVIKSETKPSLKRKLDDKMDIVSLKKRNLELQNLYLEKKIQRIDRELAGVSHSDNSKVRRIDSETSDSD